MGTNGNDSHRHLDALARIAVEEKRVDRTCAHRCLDPPVKAIVSRHHIAKDYTPVFTGPVRAIEHGLAGTRRPRESRLPSGPVPARTCTGGAATIPQRTGWQAWRPLLIVQSCHAIIASVMDVYEELVRLRNLGQKCALATIVEVRGSIPSYESAKILVREDGSMIGTIGGGCVEAEVWNAAREVIELEKPKHLTFNLGQDAAYDNGLICGGQLNVFVEPVLPLPHAF